jgi:hypothetical protein
MSSARRSLSVGALVDDQRAPAKAERLSAEREDCAEHGQLWDAVRVEFLKDLLDGRTEHDGGGGEQARASVSRASNGSAGTGHARRRRHPGLPTALPRPGRRRRAVKEGPSSAAALADSARDGQEETLGTTENHGQRAASGARKSAPTSVYPPPYDQVLFSRRSQKKHYRQRAHANPFADHALDYPASPDSVDWAAHYPAFAGSGRTPEMADVGCGFGGLLIALAPLFPDTLILGE